ncbi:hypothetical protein AX17_001523 [Amanita inopinata Kibby_2008]|nr:hypothetical protein AX17_001523 [Amanita inopinata Kibby_2008]
MVRKSKLLPLGPSKLSQILVNFRQEPKLTLAALKSIRLSYAFRNDHFGARHFVKEQLPRIRYANPTLDIQIEKARKTPQEAWRPEMEIEFTSGTTRTIDMYEKWSTVILKELMDLGGGDTWTQWKAKARASGQPIVIGEGNENRATQRLSSTGSVLPTLKAFRALQKSP